jgi:hypothetical protein
VRFVVAIAIGTCLSACGSSTEVRPGEVDSLDTGPAVDAQEPDAPEVAPRGCLVTGRAPDVHRASPVECPHDRDASRPGFLKPDGDCHSDADCWLFPNGRCTGLLDKKNICTYDMCFDDSECSGGVCTCRVEISRAGRDIFPALNLCARAGNCRIDSDCGPEGWCSPHYEEDCFGDVFWVGWFCRTSNDECCNDVDCDEIDCPSSGCDPGRGKCDYVPNLGSWRCNHIGGCT